jgi:hypothetical protein
VRPYTPRAALHGLLYYRVELLAGDDDIITLARDARDRRIDAEEPRLPLGAFLFGEALTVLL